jgi:hypothetical protein
MLASEFDAPRLTGPEPWSSSEDNKFSWDGDDEASSSEASGYDDDDDSDDGSCWLVRQQVQGLTAIPGRQG